MNRERLFQRLAQGALQNVAFRDIKTGTDLFSRHRERQRRQWWEKNRKALESCNRRIAQCGVFSDGLRRFRMVRLNGRCGIGLI